jgi:hypothetical protein
MTYTLAHIPIETLVQLQKIGSGYPLSGNYELTSDITVSGAWTPIGNGTQPFTGTFDGKENKIVLSNLPSAFYGTVPEPMGTTEVVGFFGFTRNAEIKNLEVEWNGSSKTFSSSNTLTVGIVAGWAQNTKFTNVMVTGTSFSVTGNRIQMLGALVGWAEDSRIFRCGTEVAITGVMSAGEGCTGGLVGVLGNLDDKNYNDNTMKESFAKGNVTTTGGEWTGGLIGYLGGSVEDCYATGNVQRTINDSTASGNNSELGAGGCLGKNSGSRIERSYAQGSVTITISGSGRTLIGGISGMNSWDNNGIQAQISNCAALNQVLSRTGGSGVSHIINRVGGQASLSNNIANSDMEVNGDTVSGNDNDENGKDKTSSELENPTTYSGWDFSTVWKMQGGRPVLKWQP